MAFCPNCGSQISGNFCQNCGSQVNSVQAPNMQPQTPKTILPTNFGLGKYIFLSILTLGIYGLVVMIKVSRYINIIASPYDNKRTMNYFLMCLLTIPTLGIYYFVWFHKISNRIGSELKRRNIAYNFGCKWFWLWDQLGSMIIVGPFIYYYRLFHAMNILCEDFNIRG